MLTIGLLAALVFAPTPVIAATCSGADPAITHVSASQPTTDAAGVNHYTLSITVTNLGDRKQTSNLLQSVQIWEDRQKVDQKGIPPLAPDQSYRFSYNTPRNSDAAMGSTRFDFRLVVSNPLPVGWQDCNGGNDRATLTI